MPGRRRSVSTTRSGCCQRARSGRHPDPGGGPPPPPLAGAAGAREERRQLVERQAERVPAVAERERAPERARAPAAEPDRDPRLYPARIDDEAGEAVVRAGVLGRAPAEGGAQRTERVLVARTPAVEFRAEERELLRQRPHADAQDEAPARESVERAGALRDDGRHQAEAHPGLQALNATLAAHFGIHVGDPHAVLMPPPPPRRQ